MWPLLICLLAASFVILERFLWWWGLRSRCQPETLAETYSSISCGDFERALQIAGSADEPYLQTLKQGLLNAHSSLLGAMQLRATEEIELAEKRQWVLGTFITLAPLLGLMGTVTGIMNSFHFVGSEELTAVKVSGGIAEALIATAGGLGIAILCLLPYNFFNRKLAQFRSGLERTINHAELLVESAKQRGHDLEGFARERAALTARRFSNVPHPH